MSTLNVNTINNEAGTGAPDFPNGVSVNSNPIATAGSLSNRNKIINGNFDIWQRGTSFSFSTGQYTADRWFNYALGSSSTVSRQSFTLGQADVPNEPTYFHRTVVSSVAGANNLSVLSQRLESARTFAGQTVTLSFWAKADAAKNIAVEFGQVFGSGGSPSSDVTGVGVTTCALTTSWQKFTVTASIPSISGKTLGTAGNDRFDVFLWFDAGSDYNSRTNSLGQQSGTFDIAQVQLEAGDVATPFEMRTYGQELALCQRYYEKTYAAETVPSSSGAYTNMFCASKPATTGAMSVSPRYTVTKRHTPTITIYDPVTGDPNAYRNFAASEKRTDFNVFDVGDSGFKFFAGPSVILDVAFHYTADAEL